MCGARGMTTFDSEWIQCMCICDSKALWVNFEAIIVYMVVKMHMVNKCYQEP